MTKKTIFIILSFGTITIAIVFSNSLSTTNSQYKKSQEFLNMHMHTHKTKYRKLVGFKSEVVGFSPYKYKSLYIAKKVLDSLQDNLALVELEEQDQEKISQKHINAHIKKMLHVWKNNKTARHVNFDDFLEYILPYRAGEEKLTAYSKYLYEIFLDTYDSIKLVESSAQAVHILNNKLKEKLVFDLRSHADLKKPGILDVLKAGKGSCKSLTETTTQVMRLAGLAVAIDECPVWAHRNAGHQWNAFLNENRKWVPFGGSETNPEEFNSIHDSVKAPKIYRHTYAVQENFFPSIEDSQNIPTLFRKKNRIDVTSEYVETSNVVIELKEKNISNNDLLYLAVFNAKKWKIVSWSKIKNGKAEFPDMGNNNIVYLPVFFKNGKTIPASDPFLLTPTEKKDIRPNNTYPQNFSISEYNKFYDIKWNIGKPELNWKMELFYWDAKWVSLGVCRVGNDLKLHYKNVPNNALFLIKSHDWDNTWQRIFTMEENNPVWF